MKLTAEIHQLLNVNQIIFDVMMEFVFHQHGNAMKVLIAVMHQMKVNIVENEFVIHRCLDAQVLVDAFH